MLSSKVPLRANPIVSGPALLLAARTASRNEQSASHTPSLVSAGFVIVKSDKSVRCSSVS